MAIESQLWFLTNSTTRALQHNLMAVCKTNQQRESPNAQFWTKVSGIRMKEKRGDRSRGLGMWEVKTGGVRNDSGFWVESLQLRVMPLKEKKDMRRTGLGRDGTTFLRHFIWGAATSVPLGPMKPGAATCVRWRSMLPLTCLLAV